LEGNSHDRCNALKEEELLEFHAYQKVPKLLSLHLYYDIKAIKIQMPPLPPPFSITELNP